MKLLALAALAVCLALAQKVHEACMACHNEQVQDFKSHPHFEKGLSCDACHGKSEKHRAATGGAPPDKVAAPDEQPALCGACHTSQSKSFLASKHGKLIAEHAKVKAPSCGTCHGTHALRAAKAMEAQCSRCHSALPASCKAAPVRTAKVSCAGCHDPHTSLAGR